MRRGAAAYGVLLISLLLTGLAWHYVRQNVEVQTQTRFAETTRATQEAIKRRTKAYLDAIFGARGLFYASQSVKRDEWDSYVRGIEPEERLKGLQALAFAEYIGPEERESYSRESREKRLPEMRPDLNPGGERSAYFPLKFMAPPTRPTGVASTKTYTPTPSTGSPWTRRGIPARRRRRERSLS